MHGSVEMVLGDWHSYSADGVGRVRRLSVGRARRLSTPLALAAAVVVLAAPAQAARECEQPHYAPVEGACARLATSELYHLDTGFASNRHGETVMFLHAASVNADAFLQNLTAFHAAGYRAIAYDRKNVGRSSNTQRDDALGRSRSITVGDLEDLANHLGLGRFHLVGVAAGAQVAIQYAAKNPARRTPSVHLRQWMSEDRCSALRWRVRARRPTRALPAP